jgi:AcrR family transcriptional regulator
MARQARSEATRRKIIDSAVDLFSEIGYPAAGLADIVERAELTKGALYYHFDSKESLANAIIAESAAKIVHDFQNIDDAPTPALEKLIHGMFVVSGQIDTDKVTRTGIQLLRAFGGFSETVSSIYAAWVEAAANRLRTAVVEGDVRAELDPDSAADALVGALIGTELLSSATSAHTQFRSRMVGLWQLLLPALVTVDSLEYFREFVARESLRSAHQPALD